MRRLGSAPKAPSGPAATAGTAHRETNSRPARTIASFPAGRLPSAPPTTVANPASLPRRSPCSSTSLPSRANGGHRRKNQVEKPLYLHCRHACGPGEDRPRDSRSMGRSVNLPGRTQTTAILPAFYGVSSGEDRESTASPPDHRQPQTSNIQDWTVRHTLLPLWYLYPAWPRLARGASPCAQLRPSRTVCAPSIGKIGPFH